MFEKVNPCHPDKVADRIAGAIVDLCYTKSKNPKVACEVLIGHGECNIQVETSEQIGAEDCEAIVRRIAGDGIETRALIVPQDIHLAANQQHRVRCGDNGIFKGVPPTHEQKLLTSIAESIYEQHPYDGKYIIQGKGRLAAPVFDLTVCQSHLSREQEPELREHLKNAYGIHMPIINPLGEWTGGPNTDSGATNRKLGSDMGDGVTGGGLHGKDLSKADVSVNIWCYLEAVRTGKEVTAICSIGDESLCGVPYTDIVEQARLYIHTLGGFEKFAEWGLIRPYVLTGKTYAFTLQKVTF
jgi:S-adenosylmethionine synthetase